MKVYVGQTRSRRLIRELEALGFGEMTTRTELPPRRAPWAFDNGAFKDWRSGKPFDVPAYQVALDRLSGVGRRPDFLVVPDVPAQGDESLALSLSWAPRLRGVAPLYLVVQDGMGRCQVEQVLHLFDGLFVGGSLPWKIATGRQWCEVAHAGRRPCHIGRVGTFNRVRWALRIGADSIDSALPLWSADNLRRFREALDHPQRELGLAVEEAA